MSQRLGLGKPTLYHYFPSKISILYAIHDSHIRALLDGQGWFDLRNYRLNPPGGFDIHWSRLVDLPIAGLILLGAVLLHPLLGRPRRVEHTELLAVAEARDITD